MFWHTHTSQTIEVVIDLEVRKVNKHCGQRKEERSRSECALKKRMAFRHMKNAPRMWQKKLKIKKMHRNKCHRSVSALEKARLNSTAISKPALTPRSIKREKEEFLKLTSLFFWAYVVHSSSGRMPFASLALFYPLSIVCTHLAHCELHSLLERSTFLCP